MKKNILLQSRIHLDQIAFYGIGYELNVALLKLGVIQDQPSGDIRKKLDFWDSHPELYIDEVELKYEYIMGRKLNLVDPQKFTEKIQWLKLFDHVSAKTRLADKYLLKRWVDEKLGEGHVIPVFGAWDKFDDIDFSLLPEKFVLKCNHGSSMNLIVKDKRRLDIKKAKLVFDEWMKRNYAFFCMELQYKDIDRKIIAEKYVEEMGNLYDYKVHCFNGKPKFIQVIGDRDFERHTGYQNHYDFNWRKLSWTFEDYPDFPYELQKPDRLEDLYKYAEILSREFKYVRVDCYILADEIYVGEMTFTPARGCYPYKGKWTQKKDYQLGKLLPKLTIGC